MKTKTIALATLALTACAVQAQQPPVPAYYQVAAKIIGKSGTLNADGSYRINIPRTDVAFTNWKGMPIPADLGLVTYAAFFGDESNAIVVGDTAMLAPEIDGVMDALRAGGLEIVSLHNHMSTESPRLFYMHFQGHGSVKALSSTLHDAFSLLGKQQPGVLLPANPGKPKVDWAAIELTFKVKPQTFPSGVVRFASPRKDLKVTVDGLPFTPGMGVGSWAAFTRCECGLTMVMGDTCCSSRTEVQAVIDAYRKAGISITGIHNHIYQGSQEILFLHYDGEGDAQKLATGIRAAWDTLGK